MVGVVVAGGLHLEYHHLAVVGGFAVGLVYPGKLLLEFVEHYQYGTCLDLLFLVGGHCFPVASQRAERDWHSSTGLVDLLADTHRGDCKLVLKAVAGIAADQLNNHDSPVCHKEGRLRENNNYIHNTAVFSYPHSVYFYQEKSTS